MTELLEFLHDHRKLLEYTRERSNKVTTASHNRPEVKAHGFSKPIAKTNFVYAAMDVHCNLCKDNHFTSNCAKFKTITVNQRLGLVKNTGLCINCLRPNHSAKNCRSGSCKQCNGRHHTLLYKDPNIEEQTATWVNASVLSANIRSETILATAIVHIVDNKGQLQPCRMLIDSSSQSHFLSERTALLLGLPRKRINIPVIGINRGTTNIKHSVTATIRSRINKFRTDATFLVIAHITEMLPSRVIAIEELSIPNNIPLADPKFNIPAEIDGLIGGELFLQLLCVGQIRLNHNAIALQKTQFGWILAGRVTALQSTHPIRCNLAKESIHNQLAKFWELEEPYHETIYSFEERKAEQHFVLNNTRDAQTGRYVVRLPIKDNVPALGESYSMAKGRFCSLERKFSKNLDLKVQYLEFLNQYLRLGHMTLIENSSADDGYYLPHHAIIKQSSLTTKLRVVFDASAKTSTGTSLNDHLLTGPTIQETLYALLIRFRSHSYVLTADIEKMYRQVWVHPDDLTYSTSAAPFLAIHTLHQLAIDEGKQFPHAARTLREDFYVDDLLTGANSREEFKLIRDELIQVCEKSVFKLRQWASNDQSLVDTLDDCTDATHLRLDLNNTIKTLGIDWNPRHDKITYNIKNIDHKACVMKRNILSLAVSLFDPLGLLGPIIIQAKVLLQHIWKLQLNWDESVPIDIHTKSTSFCRELELINKISVSRPLALKGHVKLQLHGFCDASEQAYGACLYMRSVDQNRTVDTRLISAKSRVAPLKTITLPRIELCAAHLVCQLYQTTVQSLHRISFERITFWSDPTITLHWMKTPSHTLKTFVAHRVTDIRNISNNIEGRHVPSLDNPADLVPRGLTTQELLHNDLRFYGPPWLRNDDSQWPESVSEPIDISETRPNKGNLSVFEIHRAERCIVQVVQLSEFHHEIHALKNAGTPTGKTALLNPFLDNDGLLRVGGRLSRANVRYDTRHPILIFKSSHVAKLIIIIEQHEKQFHAGIQATLNAVRQKFWIPQGKTLIRHILHKCIRCYRANPPDIKYKMSDLPASRVTYSRPFMQTSVDFCGPLFIKETIHRNRNKIKVYLAIFVCFTTKAVHIEIVSAKREIKELYAFLNSQNTNDTITARLTNDGISWHTIPPRSPHFGGLWEAAVRRTKHHLTRVIGDTLLSYESLLIVINQIEAILYSRPIIPLSSDPNDLHALTPGHFLIGENLTSMPDHDLSAVPTGRLSSWQHVQQLRRHFWNRWVKDYLQEQTVRAKWHAGKAPHFPIGSLVIPKEDNVPPMCWLLGRVTAVHPGDDGVVRVITIKTSRGEYKRCVKRVAPLPLYE
ncbi:uncharacterized protein LOC143184816 [Calliopsis andreniformis]|uniref:uncharacterized protein LOC143184816 n=1 Tax=Calliopsis andreniformis TaxID=337506 RepID=UPI003FCD88B7